MSNLKISPGIMDISPYKGGKSTISGKNNAPIIKLSSNENALGASPKAVQAYIAAANNLSRYPDGYSSVLRDEIANINNLDARNIICGAGSDELIALICSSYASIGDEILFSEHGFLMYRISTLKAGAVPVTAKEVDLTFNVDNILAKISDRTRIIFIANPNNPTGSYINRAELHRLRESLPSDILLVIDGAYSEYVLNDDYSDGTELVDNYDNVIVTRTFSKIYGLAALRLGWAYANENIIDILNRVRGPFNVSAAAQNAGLAAILDTEFTDTSIHHNIMSLKFLTGELKKLGFKYHPTVGNFILIDFADIAGQTANDANEFLLSQNIIVRSVTNYQLPNSLRISVGTEQENTQLIQALGQFKEHFS
ncbi:MAG: histidinol-phosphate transaminase [Pseudomonadota bacterium]